MASGVCSLKIDKFNRAPRASVFRPAPIGVVFGQSSLYISCYSGVETFVTAPNHVDIPGRTLLATVSLHEVLFNLKKAPARDNLPKKAVDVIKFSAERKRLDTIQTFMTHDNRRR